MSLLACLVALLALKHVQGQEQDPILNQCKRNGWIFLHKVQQKSWQAIMHCDEKREPRIACEGKTDCIAYTSNGNSGNGWMYRLPRLKACGPLDDPKSLDWEWSWSWVPMTCKDPGPCCGTYLANSAGEDAAFIPTCDSSAGSAPAFDAFSCEKKCPTLHTTHPYSSIKQWEVQCKQQRRQAGRETRHRALLGTNRGKQYQAVVVKRPSAASRRRAFIEAAESRACSAVSQFCNDF